MSSVPWKNTRTGPSAEPQVPSEVEGLRTFGSSEPRYLKRSAPEGAFSMFVVRELM
jgi:hypothetical protein